MLEWAKTNLQIRASDEWNYDIIDADPLINLLIEACASEAKLAYDAIQESDDRVFNRILRYLIPEAFQFPRPSIAIMKAQPSVSSVIILPEQSFKVTSGSNIFSFTPLWETKLIGAKVRYIALNENILDLQKAQPFSFNEIKLSRILLGLEFNPEISDINTIQLYFDWAEIHTKYIFLNALSNAQWYCNGEPVISLTGIQSQDNTISEQFSSDLYLKNKVKGQYRLNFHSIQCNEDLLPIDDSPKKILNNWLLNFGIKNEYSVPSIKGESNKYIWIQIDLSLPITLVDTSRYLTIGLNHFPIVNRALIRKSDHETYFSDSFGVEIINLKPYKGLFCGIHSVTNLKNNETIQPEMISRLFKDDTNQIKYSLRYSGVGRSDNLNTWQRFSYLLSLFRQEHLEQKSIENLGIKLSLEEIHELLGKRISNKVDQSWDETGTTDVYIIIKLGNIKKLDTEIKYWTTDGDLANQISAGTSLYLEPAVPGIDSIGMQLVTETRDGKNSISASTQTAMIQDAIFRKNRIVTVDDIKRLCRLKLGDKITDIQIKPFFSSIGGVSIEFKRIIGVNIKVLDINDRFCHQVAQEIEWILHEESTGTIPYKVNILAT